MLRTSLRSTNITHFAKSICLREFSCKFSQAMTGFTWQPGTVFGPAESRSRSRKVSRRIYKPLYIMCHLCEKVIKQTHVKLNVIRSTCLTSLTGDRRATDTPGLRYVPVHSIHSHLPIYTPSTQNSSAKKPNNKCLASWLECKRAYIGLVIYVEPCGIKHGLTLGMYCTEMNFNVDTSTHIARNTTGNE